MTLYVDGAYVFKKLFYQAREDERVVFNSSYKIGYYVPINSYYLTFDLYTRILNHYLTFIEKLKHKYNNIVFIYSPIKAPTFHYYDIYLKRFANFRDYRTRLMYAIKSYETNIKKRPLYIDKLLTIMKQRFHLFTHKNKKKQNDVKKSITRLAFYVSIFQNYVHPKIYNYLYETLATDPINDYVIDIRDMSQFKNTTILTKHKIENNVSIKLRYNMVKNVFDYVVRNEKTPLTNEHLKNEIKIKKIKRRKLLDVCNETYGVVLNVNDDETTVMLNNIHKIYVGLVRNEKFMKYLQHPKMLMKSNYRLLRKTLLKINDYFDLNISSLL